jgi:ribonuclease BN (tRNA processing enzyme)
MPERHAPLLELVILGAGPAYSNVPGSLGSGYLVRTREHAVVVDLGQGCFPSLAAEFEPGELSAVFISHLHPDHFIDLIPLRHYLRRPGAEAAELVPLLAPPGLDDRVDATYATPGFSAAAFEHRQLRAGQLEAGPFSLEVRQVRHAGESFAVRLALLGGGGGGLVYTGDVSDVEDIRPLIRPGDLLLAEATFGPGPVPEAMPHIDSRSVGRLAAETSAAQVIITHVRMGTDLQATMAALRAGFAGPASLARPGARFLVPSA